MTKYGLVPAEVMPENYIANHTNMLSNILALKLREFGLRLRDMAAKESKKNALKKEKTKMLSTIYHILSISLGEPPTEFTWTRKNAGDRPVETKKFTPLSFYQTYVGTDLKNNYVMLMNDPSRP